MGWCLVWEVGHSLELHKWRGELLHSLLLVGNISVNYPMSYLCAGLASLLVGGALEEATGEVLVTQQSEFSADSVSLTLEEGRLV